jgi:hypothetical protein
VEWIVTKAMIAVSDLSVVAFPKEHKTWQLAASFLHGLVFQGGFGKQAIQEGINLMVR